MATNYETGTIFANRYNLIAKIGFGGFSEVWKAEDIIVQNTVALKIFDTGRGLDSDGKELFRTEYLLVEKLNHSNLLKPSYFGIWEERPYLVLRFMPLGSLRKRRGRMSEGQIISFLTQACEALRYLHGLDKPIIHQDIKPDNFLIDENDTYLLSDFGISSEIRDTLTRTKTKVASEITMGSQAYMPPEKFSKNIHERQLPAGDIWALGVTVFELVTGELAFGEYGGINQLHGEEAPNLPKEFSYKLNRLVNKMLSKNPAKRPSAQEVLEFLPKIVANPEGGFLLSFFSLFRFSISQKSKKLKIVLLVCLFSLAVAIGFFQFKSFIFEDREPGVYLNRDVLPGTPIIIDILKIVPFSENSIKANRPYYFAEINDKCLSCDTVYGSFKKGTLIQWYYLKPPAGLYLKADCFSGSPIEKEILDVVKMESGSDTIGRPIFFEKQLANKGYRLKCNEHKNKINKGTLITWSNIEKMGGVYLTQDLTGNTQILRNMLKIIPENKYCFEENVRPLSIEEVEYALAVGAKTDTLKSGTILLWRNIH